MTATNMCSNFGGKWDSDYTWKLGKKSDNLCSYFFYAQNCSLIYVLYNNIKMLVYRHILSEDSKTELQ